MNYRCNRCGEPPAGKVFESDKPVCPDCGANGIAGGVVELTPVHFVSEAPDGPIKGMNGVRLRVACQPKRAVMAAHALDVHFHASADPRAVTCASCRGTPAWQGPAKAIADVERAVRGGVSIDGGGG